MRDRKPLSGIRARTTAAAVIVVGLALLFTAALMVRLVERSLISAEADQAQVRAGQIARHAFAHGSPIRVSAPDDEYVQIIAHGIVVASSANAGGLGALAAPSPGKRVRLDSVPFAEGPFVAVAARMETAEGAAQAVVVGRSIDDAAETRRTLTRILAFGVPALLALVGLVTWKIVGQALRPVEDLRREVDRISSQELHRRVPNPGGDDEIARLATTMNRMLDRLEGAQGRLRQFISDASHELRSPVASIRQQAEVAREHPDSTTVPELAREVLKDDARLQRLVDDLLLLTKLDEGVSPRPEAEVDLDDLVLAEAARLRATTPLNVDTHRVSVGRVLARLSDDQGLR